jgi:hypothetical protein
VASPPSAPSVTSVAPAVDSSGVDESAGVLSRFVVDLWARLGALQHQLSFRVSASLLELYGEEVLDLLADDVLEFLPAGAASASGEADLSASSARPLRAREPLSIREDRVRGTVVVGLRNVRVRSATETFDLLRTGLRNRTTASTVLNDLSSRSHLVVLFQVGVRCVQRSHHPFALRYSTLWCRLMPVITRGLRRPAESRCLFPTNLLPVLTPLAFSPLQAQLGRVTQAHQAEATLASSKSACSSLGRAKLRSQTSRGVSGLRRLRPRESK